MGLKPSKYWRQGEANALARRNKHQRRDLSHHPNLTGGPAPRKTHAHLGPAPTPTPEGMTTLNGNPATRRMREGTTGPLVTLDTTTTRKKKVTEYGSIATVTLVTSTAPQTKKREPASPPPPPAGGTTGLGRLHPKRCRHSNHTRTLGNPTERSILYPHIHPQHTVQQHKPGTPPPHT